MSSIPRPRLASFSLHISTTGGSGAIASSSTAGGSSPSNLGRVPLDARVVLSRRRSGYVRFIGKLKNESGEWYGVALDEAKGDHDGSWQGEHVFACAPNRGVFVRRKEIFYIKEQTVKSPPSPVTNDSCDESSNTSVTSHDSSETPSPPPVQVARTTTIATTTTTTTASPLQRTFKSFRRVLQSPVKLGESVAHVMSTTPKPGLPSPSKRTSLIPPPAIATRHQSFVVGPSLSHLKPQSLSPRAVEPRPVAQPANVPAPPSLFDEADAFASMTQALAEHNNSSPTVLRTPDCPAPPPQIDDNETDLATTPPRRISMPDRRHSTFAFGSSTVSSAAATAAARAVRIVELEKEIVTMRTNHENVVAVLRATNKQHAANVLELRAQVSGLTDGNGYLQKQLSAKSALLFEAKQAERARQFERDELVLELGHRDARITELESDVATLQAQLDAVHSENRSVLVDLQREFQLKLQRDRRQINQLRQDVVSMCNARNAVQHELRDTKDLAHSFLF